MEYQPHEKMVENGSYLYVAMGATTKASEQLAQAGLNTIRTEPMAAYSILDKMYADESFPYERYPKPLQNVNIVIVDKSELKPLNFGLLGGKLEHHGICTLTENTKYGSIANVLVSATVDGKFIGNEYVHEILVHELQHAHDALYSPDSGIEDQKVYRSKLRRVKAELFGVATLYFAGNAAFVERQHDITGSTALSTTIGVLGGLAAWGIAKNSKAVKGRAYRSYYKDSPLETRARNAQLNLDEYPKAIHIS